MEPPADHKHRIDGKSRQTHLSLFLHSLRISYRGAFSSAFALCQSHDRSVRYVDAAPVTTSWKLGAFLEMPQHALILSIRGIYWKRLVAIRSY